MINHRTWYYLGAFIILAMLIVFGAIESSTIHRQQILIQSQSTSQLNAQVQQYASAQTDAHKLVSFAKLVQDAGSSVQQILFDRAYTLSPNERDIVVLDSQFHPELKAKVTALDPLASAN